MTIRLEHKLHDFLHGSSRALLLPCSSGVWIGDGAVVMPGITIGPGAVIGANSVVTHNVAPYEVVGGVPARRIRRRFPDDISNSLVESRWWDASLEAESKTGLECV